MTAHRRLRRIRTEHDTVREVLSAATALRPGDAALADVVRDLERLFLQRLYATFEAVLRTEVAGAIGIRYEGIAVTVRRVVGEETTRDPASGLAIPWWTIAQRDRNALQHGDPRPPALGLQATIDFLVALLLRLGVRE